MTTPRRVFIFAAVVAASAAFAACGGGEPSSGAGAAEAPAGPAQLTQAQLEKGIGPVDRVELGALNEELAEQGLDVFTIKCSACHKLAERYVGPPLGDVLDRRTPEYVMNMILNPDEMVRRHPEVQKLLAQYYTPMPNQNLTREEARAVLEYLRSGGAGS